MQSIRAIVPQPPKDPESADGRTFLIQTKLRDYILRSPTGVEYRRWTFLLSRMSKVNHIGTVPRNSIRITDDLEYPENEDDPEKIKRYTSQSAIVQALKPSSKRMSTWQESVGELMNADPESRKSIVSISARSNRNTNDQSRMQGNGNRRTSYNGGIPAVPAIPNNFTGMMTPRAQNVPPQDQMAFMGSPQAQFVGSLPNQSFGLQQQQQQQQQFMGSPNQSPAQFMGSQNQDSQFMGSLNQGPPQFIAQNQVNGQFVGSPNQGPTQFIGSPSQGPGWKGFGMDNQISGFGNDNLWDQTPKDVPVFTQGSLSRGGPDVLGMGKSPNSFGSSLPQKSNNYGSVKSEAGFLGPPVITTSNEESPQLTEKFPWEKSDDKKLNLNLDLDLGLDLGLWKDESKVTKPETTTATNNSTSTQSKPEEKPRNKNRLSVSNYGNANRRSTITGYRNSRISMISEAGNVLPKQTIQQLLEPETPHNELVHACNGLLRVLLRLQGFTGDDPQLPLEKVLLGKGFPDATTPGRDYQPLLPYFKNFALKSIPYFFGFIREYVDSHIEEISARMSSAVSVDEKASLHDRISALRVRMVDLKLAEDEWGSAIVIVLEKRGDVPAVERAVKKNVA
ncbi:hypothetical protein HK096_008677, partial [Nowakowskiella sp. JEL0078]